MSDAAPLALGTLGDTPFPALLALLIDQRLDGTLVLELPPNHRSAVQLVGGVPAKARTVEPVVYLGRLLLHMGLLDEATYRDSVRRAVAERRLHGELLLTEGLLPPEQLQRGLKEQVARRLLWLCELPPETDWGVYPADYLARWGGEPTPVDAMALLWRMVKQYSTEAQMAATLGALAGVELRFDPDAQPARFKFDAREQAAIDVLRVRPHSLEGLVATRLLGPLETHRLVYLLALARCFDRGDPTVLPLGITERARRAEPARRGAVPTPAPPPAAPASSQAGVAPEHAAQAAELSARLADLDKLTHYQVLGVAPTADSAAIQAAFFALAKRWHPDRLPGGLAPLRDSATRLFARINEANTILSKAESRKRYDEALAGAGTGDTPEEQEQVERALRAAMAFQRAEVLYKKQSYEAAEAELARAMQDDPTQTEYGAFFALLASRDPTNLHGTSLATVLALLDKAVAAEPENMRVRLWRGQVLNRAGRGNEAIKEFRRVVEKDPKNVDAQREIRIHEMRKGAPAEAPPSGQAPTAGAKLIDRLFKR